MNFRSFGLVCLLALLSTSDAAAQTWTSLGPTGGSVEHIVVAPSQASTILAIPGNDAGGLFLSTNSGATWTSIAPGLCDAHVTSVAFHPTQPSTIVAGTLSAGVCRTTDTGATWTALASGLPTDSNNFPRSVRAIAINPSTPTTMIAGTLAGLYRSTDSGATWTLAGGSGIVIDRVAISPSTPALAYATGATGVLRSTDSGATWTSANTGLPLSFEDSSLTIDPTNGNVVYVSESTVYKTSDGGTSWSASNSGLNSGSAIFTTNVALDSTNPSVLYVNSIGGSGLSKSTNGGASWTALSNTGLPSFSGIPGVTQTLAIEPGSATNLLAGAPGAGAFRSTDAGATWVAINTNLNARQVYSPALQPGTGTGPAPLLISTRTETDASEIHKLTAGALPFSTVPSPFSANDSGDIEWMVVDPTNASTIYVLGGAVSGQDCALPYKTTDGGTSWTLMNSGLATTLCGNHLVLDPASPGTVYLAMFFPGSSSSVIGLYKSTNGGATWTASNTGINGGVNRIAISPLNSSLLYAGGFTQVYRSTNGGTSWTTVATGLPTFSGSSGSNVGVNHLAIDPVNDAIVYAGTHAGVYRTANGGTSWTGGTSGWPTLNGTLHSVGALAIDPVTPTTLVAAPATPPNGPSGFLGSSARGVGLYRSTDSGATWTAVTGAIAGAIVTEVVFDADRAIYATTNNGLFKFAAALPTITIDKSSLAFSAVTDGAALLQKTSAQAVRITQSGTGTVTWTASSTTPWLVVSPTSGSGSASLSISVQFAAGLAATQSGSITLTFTGAANAAGPIAATFNTLTSTAAAAPFGSFDTPTDGATGIAGSIAVTGWSLDDLEVTRVRILRDPVAGEPAGALVFIGDAVLVDGARPDVQGSFPNLPRASRAGWGYLMLTNFLPALGNGTFVLHAIADDADGHSTTLGTKTITCNNASATTPFGAIDTPLQGELVTSASLNNFGWVLAPGSRKAAPPDGGTVRVVIDGALGVTPAGWTSRSDLSALFPVADFSGIGNALGVATLDMTTLANGVHTIAWLVTDNTGGAAGVGSRYFTVASGSGLLLDPSGAGAARARATVISSNPMTSLPPAALMMAAPERDPIAGRRGFDPDAPLQRYAIADGRATMQSEELDRIELHLDGSDAAHRPEGASYAGYLRVGGGFAPLPAGSALNRETGEFTWHPGVAFVGAYDFVFARVAGGDAVSRREVRIVLNPKGSGRIGPQTVIDVADSFLVAGWAADLDSQVDSGVDAIHVWAYPADGGDPVWAGVADYGGARPDVAAIFGQRFLNSGYGLRIAGLAPGTYDLAVFAYSTVRGRFVPAKVARISVPSR